MYIVHVYGVFNGNIENETKFAPSTNYPFKIVSALLLLLLSTWQSPMMMGYHAKITQAFDP